MTLLAATQVQAVEPYQEYGKRVESSQNITALKGDLFGDNVSLFNGKTEFVVTDIDVPGNNALPVQLTRRFSVEIQPSGTQAFNPQLGGAGGWDVDVPYITGMFGPVSGWASNRCSGSMVPTVSSSFSLTEIWQGNTIHVPGGGDRTMLVTETDTPVPSDGSNPRWTTSQRDMIDCIPMQSGLAGEGYRVRTSSGLRYYFDIAIQRAAGRMSKVVQVGGMPVSVGRTRVYLLASKLEDRFGNVVNYSYTTDGHPDRIWSSDGREIVLSYSNGLLDTASSHGKTWLYRYAPVEGLPWLSTVIRPDQSQWSYSYSNALMPPYEPWDGSSNSTCSLKAPPVAANFVLTANHPSGAIGTFNFVNRRHGRSGVHASECHQRIADGQYYYELGTPNYFDVMSLSSKSIAGPGISGTYGWSYSYGPLTQALWGSRGSPAAYPCTTCAAEKAVTVVNPDGTKIVYRYGFQYALNEGRILGQSTYAVNGTPLRSESITYLSEVDAAALGLPGRFGLIVNGDDPSTARVRPATESVIVQDGTVLRSAVAQACYGGSGYCFDSLGRPTLQTKSSAPAP